MDDLITVADLADYLKLSEKTILKMVKNGEIPCARIANQYRFSRLLIEDWIMSKMDVIPQNDLSRLIEREYDFVPLSRLITEKNILLDMKAENKEEVLSELSENAVESGLVSDLDLFLARLRDRERITSTAIGKGVAIPHVRTPSEKIINEPRIIIGVSPNGIDFSSADGSLTHLFFLLLSDSETVHLRILSKLSAILRDEENITELRNLKSKEAFVRFFIKMEQSLYTKE
ncbi:MAG: PTS sugar transporter subunit IIA [Spirochaetales bacterium]|nr:PTS sugar transporter subunit IIA [Spirochaetales bacterium]